MSQPSLFIISKMKTDRKLTARIQAWLEAPQHTDSADIVAGATMLLQCNRNHAMFNQIVRNPIKYVDKIKYELGKFLPARLDDMTREDVIALNNEIMPEVSAAIQAESSDSAIHMEESANPLSRKGIRPDHDSLPPEIQKLWTDNAERWKKIKQIFETCKAIAKPCERYTHLDTLKQLWYTYKTDMNSYDDFVLIPAAPARITAESPAVTTDAAELARDINNARSYISKNTITLIKLSVEATADGADEKVKDSFCQLKAKVQERVTLLVDNGQAIGDDIKSRLQPVGISFGDTATQEVLENEQGAQHIDDTEAAE